MDGDAASRERLADMLRTRGWNVQAFGTIAAATYALVPEPSPALLERYLATLAGEKERAEAVKLLQEYSQPRVLTFRTKAL